MEATRIKCSKKKGMANCVKRCCKVQQAVREVMAAIFGNMKFTEDWQEEPQDRTLIRLDKERCGAIKDVQPFQRLLSEGVTRNVELTGGKCGASGDTTYYSMTVSW